jgi:nitrogen fixation/metabolism regulation signal transduction histidine kinase
MDVARDVVGIWELLMIVAAFIIAMVFIRFAVVGPIRKLTFATQQISVGKDADLGAAGIDARSGNELDQLALATERLRLSINMAIQRLTRKGR